MNVKYKDEHFTCLIDESDFELIKSYNATWRVKFNGKKALSGVCCTKWIDHKAKQVHLHRIIMNCPPDKVVDHINRNPLDNRRSNLRICSKSENGYNQSKKKSIKGRKTSSEYIGVSKIGVHYHVHVKGYKQARFDNEIVAANYYNHMVKDKYGEFAHLNDVEFISLEECEKQRRKRNRKSKYKYVYFNNKTGKWQAKNYDKELKKLTHLGYFDNEDDAYQCILDFMQKGEEIEYGIEAI